SIGSRSIIVAPGNKLQGRHRLTGLEWSLFKMAAFETFAWTISGQIFWYSKPRIFGLWLSSVFENIGCGTSGCLYRPSRNEYGTVCGIDTKGTQGSFRF